MFVFENNHTHPLSLNSQEQALNTIKQNGRSDILSNILNKQSQVEQIKIKETNGHLTKVSRQNILLRIMYNNIIE